MIPDEDRTQPARESVLDRYLLTVLGVVGLLSIPAAVAWFASRVASPRELPSTAFPEESFPAQGYTLREYRQEMENRLGSLGWIDREKGIAHVPIELGMKVLLERGLPARQEPPDGGKKQ